MEAELQKALKECVEATGDVLDGNNNDYNWLIKHGASIVRASIKERDDYEAKVEKLKAENKMLREALEDAIRYAGNICDDYLADKLRHSLT